MKILENFNKIFDNWPVKAACILMAICLYIFYTLSIQDKRSFTVPLNVQSQNGIAIAGSYPRKAKITLKGKTEEIASIRESEFAAYIDLNYLYKDGTYKVPVVLDIPKSALLLDTMEVSVSPETVSVKVEEQIKGWVKVHPLTSGVPAHGYEVKNITVTPEEIEICGPRSMVENCTRVQTQVVSVKNAEVSFEKQVFPENLGSFLTAVNKEKVSVEVEIVPVSDLKKIDSIPLVFENLHKDFEIKATPAQVKVTLGGNLIELENFVPSKDIAKINCAEITEEGIYDLPVEYIIPSKLSLQDSVKSVKVEIRKSKPSDLPEEKDEEHSGPDPVKASEGASE